MSETRFYICRNCGNIVGLIRDAGVPLMCCGQEMRHMIPGETEASAEKHFPTAEREGDLVKVSVGAAAHPMTEEHGIQWVYLQTDRGGQRKALVPGEKPSVSFALMEETPVSVYAYCNLHGLWKADL